LKEPWQADQEKNNRVAKTNQEEEEEAKTLRQLGSDNLDGEEYERLLRKFTMENNSKSNLEELDQAMEAFYDGNLKKR
jgi:hypothetical protein